MAAEWVKKKRRWGQHFVRFRSLANQCGFEFFLLAHTKCLRQEPSKSRKIIRITAVVAGAAFLRALFFSFFYCCVCVLCLSEKPHPNLKLLLPSLSGRNRKKKRGLLTITSSNNPRTKKKYQHRVKMAVGGRFFSSSSQHVFLRCGQTHQKKQKTKLN